MSKDTYKRIEDGLKASLNGQLKWLPGDIVPNPMTTSTTTSPRSHNNNQSSFGGVGLKETAISPLEAALGGAARRYQESGFSQDNLSNLLAVDTGDVLGRHYVKPSAYLQFLSDGFHELLKCRQVKYVCMNPLFIALSHIDIRLIDVAVFAMDISICIL